MIETLESRTLMSVSPATLSQDQVKLQSDMATYAADQESCKLLIAKDKAQVSADTLTGRRLLAGLEAQLQKDQATRTSTLGLDRGNEKTALAGDNGVIARDNVTIRVDKNNPTQLPLDKQKLMSDKIQLASDKAKFGTILINDQAHTQSVILADQQAIVSARETLDNPALNTDQQTLLADQQTCLAKLAADQINILNDEVVIARDTVSA
jgi:hypothetical protein